MRSGRRRVLGAAVGVLTTVVLTTSSGCSGDVPAAREAEPGTAAGDQVSQGSPVLPTLPTVPGTSDDTSDGTGTGGTDETGGTGSSEGPRHETGSGDGGSGVEVPPAEGEDETGAGLPGVDPVRAPGPLLEAPLPGAGFAQGRLVDGYPDVAAPLGGSTTVSSSVSPRDPRLQVALEATTLLGPDTVLRRYRSRLGAAGMAEVPATAVAGSQAVGFRRGDSTLVVTVRPDGGRTSYTVYGVLRLGGE